MDEIKDSKKLVKLMIEIKLAEFLMSNTSLAQSMGLSFDDTTNILNEIMSRASRMVITGSELAKDAKNKNLSPEEFYKKVKSLSENDFFT